MNYSMFLRLLSPVSKIINKRQKEEEYNHIAITRAKNTVLIFHTLQTDNVSFLFIKHERVPAETNAKQYV